MLRFPFTFALSYVVSLLVFEAFAKWRFATGSPVAGGFGMLAVALSVFAVGAYFVRQQRRLPNPAERLRFVGFTIVAIATIELLGVAPLVSWARGLSPDNRVLGGVVSFALSAVGLWVSWSPTLTSMRRYLEKRRAPAA